MLCGRRQVCEQVDESDAHEDYGGVTALLPERALERSCGTARVRHGAHADGDAINLADDRQIEHEDEHVWREVEHKELAERVVDHLERIVHVQSATVGLVALNVAFLHVEPVAENDAEQLRRADQCERHAGGQCRVPPAAEQAAAQREVKHEAALAAHEDDEPRGGEQRAL